MKVHKGFGDDPLLLKKVVLDNSVPTASHQTLCRLIQHLKQLGIVNLRDRLLSITTALGSSVILHLHRLSALPYRLGLKLLLFTHRDEFRLAIVRHHRLVQERCLVFLWLLQGLEGHLQVIPVVLHLKPRRCIISQREKVSRVRVIICIIAVTFSFRLILLISIVFVGLFGLSGRTIIQTILLLLLMLNL